MAQPGERLFRPLWDKRTLRLHPRWRELLQRDESARETIAIPALQLDEQDPSATQGVLAASFDPAHDQPESIASLMGKANLPAEKAIDSPTPAMISAAVAASENVSTSFNASPVVGPPSPPSSPLHSTSTISNSVGASAPLVVASARAAPPTCCGSCGYINCPTQLLGPHADKVAQAPLAGQLGGNGADGVADFVAITPAVFGSSVSASLSTDNLGSAAGWRDRLSDVATPASAALPGGDGTGSAATLTGQVGILNGEVTDQSSSSSMALTADATSTNPIVLENEKPGNPESEWGIDGAGDSNIEGFATDISVDHGNTIDFKINTDSSHYRIDIYRLGYYGGMGARKVATIDHTGVQNQPDPLSDPTTGLVDAGNWAVSASWAVPADAVSGVYIAKLTRLDGTSGENQIPFIVRDDSSHGRDGRHKPAAGRGQRRRACSDSRHAGNDCRCISPG